MLLWRLMNQTDIAGVADLMARPRLSHLTSLHTIPPATIRQHAAALLDKNVWCETSWMSGKCVGMIALRDTLDGCAWLSVVVDSERLGLWPAMIAADRAVQAMMEAAPQDAVYMCRTHIKNSASMRILWRRGWKCEHVDDPWTVWQWTPDLMPRKTGVGTNDKRRINGGTDKRG
jgi:hypothetical protein